MTDSIVIDLDAYTKPNLAGYGSAPLVTDETRMAGLLWQLAELGTSFLCPADSRLIAILASINEDRQIDVIPLVLDAARQSRELQTYGLAGFARRRLLSSGAVGAARATLSGLSQATSLFRREFVASVLFLSSLELNQFSRFEPRKLFLHANTADLCTVTRNRGLFDGFARLAISRGMRPGTMTNNAGLLLPLLREWELDMSVGSPVSRDGYHMKPDPVTCAEAARAAGRELIALLHGPLDAITAEDVASIRRFGAGAIAISPTSSTQLMRLLDLLA